MFLIKELIHSEQVASVCIVYVKVCSTRNHALLWFVYLIVHVFTFLFFLCLLSQKYMHESRHNHAKRRVRGFSGRFTSASSKQTGEVAVCSGATTTVTQSPAISSHDLSSPLLTATSSTSLDMVLQPQAVASHPSPSSSSLVTVSSTLAPLQLSSVSLQASSACSSPGQCTTVEEALKVMQDSGLVDIQCPPHIGNLTNAHVEH